MMPYRALDHHRQSIRLQGYDYAQQGAYFVTMCTQDRACLFGEILDGAMVLNAAGRIALDCWKAIPLHFPHFELDAFVVMPNHVHGVLWIVERASAHGPTEEVGAKNLSPLPQPFPHSALPTVSGSSGFQSPSKTIGSVVRGFKIGVTKWMRTNTAVRDVWQRGYYEHVIRDEAALQRIRQYINDNPVRWTDDHEHPAHNCVLANRKGRP